MEYQPTSKELKSRANPNQVATLLSRSLYLLIILTFTPTIRYSLKFKLAPAAALEPHKLSLPPSFKPFSHACARRTVLITRDRRLCYAVSSTLNGLPPKICITTNTAIVDGCTYWKANLLFWNIQGWILKIIPRNTTDGINLLIHHFIFSTQIYCIYAGCGSSRLVYLKILVNFLA